jgi:RHS repeat-associated protein
MRSILRGVYPWLLASAILCCLQVCSPLFSASAAIPYDVNNDTSINGKDREALLNTILGVDISTGDVDCNRDGKLDVADLISLVNFILVNPPSPYDVAPELDPTVDTSLLSEIQFLYLGDPAIQHDADPEAFDPSRVAVLRGQVLDRARLPVSGARIAIHSHPEYGYALTRADGHYDMAVNGGGLLIVNCSHDGYLPVQRQVEVPWQDYVRVDPISLTQLDSKVTAITLASIQGAAVAEGNTVTDEDGPRTARILVPQGVQASMRLADQSLVPLSDLSIRATEYTVDDDGPDAMPAILPPSSAYTYCVEYSVDEALAAGAVSVEFDQPLYHYNDNFLDIPVGEVVPMGYYSHEKSQWIPSDNGLVIELLSVSDGLADLDLTGDGQPADEAAYTSINLTQSEREQLALMYSPGASFWRSPISHFSPVDCNWPYVPDPLSEPPDEEKPRKRKKKDPCEKNRSWIEVQNQDLRERVPIVGTGFSLNYSSDRTPARNNSLEISLSGPGFPYPLLDIQLNVGVAGRFYNYSFPAQENLSYAFHWDGEDAYGRTLQGPQPISATIAYSFPAVFASGLNFSRAFSAFGGVPLEQNRTRGTYQMPQRFSGMTIGGLDARTMGLGGWTLDAHHRYFPNAGVLYKGDGEDITAESFSGTLEEVRELSTSLRDGDIAPDGSLYYSDINASNIFRVLPDGSSYVYTHISGSDPHVYGVAAGPDGAVYWSLRNAHTVWRKRKDGTIEKVAGSGLAADLGDGVPALDTRLYNPHGIDIGPDGSLYIADYGEHRVRRVTPDGIIHTIAGTGQQGTPGGDEGKPATEVDIRNPIDVKVGPDGSVYFLEFLSSGQYLRGSCLRRIGMDGLLQTVAGGPGAGYSGDGGPAKDALIAAYSMDIGKDGSIYLITKYQGSSYDPVEEGLRVIDSNGIINTIAGNGSIPASQADGGLAVWADLQMADAPVAPNGDILIMHRGVNVFDQTRLFRVRKPSSLYSTGELLIPSDNGDEAYLFSAAGRHLKTFNALTGKAVYEFFYNTGGYLTRVVDAYGRQTTIERNTKGNPTAIIGPYNHRSSLSINADGYLKSIANPESETYQFAYTSAGLLEAITDPRMNTSRFGYDGVGNLTNDEDAAGGWISLARSNTRADTTIFTTTAMDRETTYSLKILKDGSERRTVSWTDDIHTTMTAGPNGDTQTDFPDGLRLTSKIEKDDRWGMWSPFTNYMSETTDDGLQSILSRTRTTSLSDESDPLSLQTMTDTLTINGRIFTSSFDDATNRILVTSAEDRKTSCQLNQAGLVDAVDFGDDLKPIQIEYDNEGHILKLRQDGRATSYAYNTAGLIQSHIDTLGQEATYKYDAADRLIETRLSSGRKYSYNYDQAGNITRLTMPNGAIHQLSYEERNLGAGYLPPSNNGKAYTYAYDLDSNLTGTTLPNGRIIAWQYDKIDLLTNIIYPEASVSLTYDPLLGGGGTRATSMTRVASSDGQSQTVGFQYDSDLLTRLSYQGASNGVYDYRYDNDFQLVGVSFDGGPEAPFSWDDDGLRTGVGPFTIERDGPLGSPSRIFDAASNVIMEYDLYGDLTRRALYVDGEQIFDLRLSRDVGGRVTGQTEWIDGAVARTLGYSYENDGLLDEVRLNDTVVQQYTYDVNGNCTGTLASTATYDPQDRLLTHGGLTYQFDDDGFLAARGADTFQYSATGELLKAEVGGETITYAYDGIGRRVACTDSSGTVQYLYGCLFCPFLVTATRDASGVLTTYLYDDNDFLIGFNREGALYYVAVDQVGTPRVIAGANGDVVKTMQFDPRGVMTSDSNPSFDFTFGFACGLADPTTGLVRFGLRDYEPLTGRWTARDPLFFAASQGNLYAYIGNDPINRRDPSGLRIKVPAKPLSNAPLLNELKDSLGLGLDMYERIKDHVELHDFLDDPNETWLRKKIAEFRCILKHIPWSRLPVLGNWYKEAFKKTLTKGVENVEKYHKRLDKELYRILKEAYLTPCEDYDDYDKRRKLPCD